MYTANLVEVLYNVIRKKLRTKEVFPTKDTEAKLIHLAVKMHEKGDHVVRGWIAAKPQLAIMFES